MQVIAVSINSGLVEFPTGYDLAWQQGNVSIWQPIAPAGYAPIGCLFGVGTDPPPLSAIACVHQKVSTSLRKRGVMLVSSLQGCILSVDSAVAYLHLQYDMKLCSNGSFHTCFLAASVRSSCIFVGCPGAGEDRVRAMRQALGPRRCKQ